MHFDWPVALACGVTFILGACVGLLVASLNVAGSRREEVLPLRERGILPLIESPEEALGNTIMNLGSIAFLRSSRGHPRQSEWDQMLAIVIQATSRLDRALQQLRKRRSA